MGWFGITGDPFAGVSDEQAMDRVRRHGDPAALAELMRRWRPGLTALGARMTGRPHLGDDLAQEAFVRVFLHRERYDPTRRFSTWIWRIALNLCHDQRRRDIRLAEDPLDGPETGREEVAEDAPCPAAGLLRRERDEEVHQAVAALPEPMRAVLVMKEFHGLKIREIAEILDVPEGTVKSRLANALDRLAQTLRTAASIPPNPAPTHPPTLRMQGTP